MPAEIDPAILKAAQEGDDAALTALIYHYQALVFTLAYRVVKDAHEAEDVAQDVFIKVIKNLRRFRGDSKFSVWLYRIVYNAALNRLKKKPRSGELLTRDDGEEMPIPDCAEGINPGALALLAERQVMVRRAVDHLPQNYRVAITFYYLEELSYCEIADVMGVPLGTVKTYLSRSKQALRKILLRKEFSGLTV